MTIYLSLKSSMVYTNKSALRGLCLSLSRYPHTFTTKFAYMAADRKTPMTAP